MLNFIIYLIAGLGAGIGTGLAGLSAAAVISPMLITFLHFEAYEAVGIALASDVLASAVSSYTYAKNKNIDIKNGLAMLFSTLVFTVLGSFLAYFPEDLKGRAMLGDTGSNVLGGVIGFSLITAAGIYLKLFTLTFLLLVHIYSEYRSLSLLIEETVWLKLIDDWGRK